MSARSWMPLYIADYLADTAHLTGAESGAYLHLIMHYWQRGSLPNDDARLASIAKASLDQWLSMKPTIAEFFGDGWTHARVDEELRKSTQAYENRAKAGRKGGLANHRKSEQCSSNASALLNQPQPQPHIDDEMISARGAPEVQKVEKACREAAGVSDSPSPGLCDMSPILGLIDQGADLEAEILPALRAKPNPRAASWRYFVPQIQQSRANRKAAAEAALPNANAPNARAGPPARGGGVAYLLKQSYELERQQNAGTEAANLETPCRISFDAEPERGSGGGDDGCVSRRDVEILIGNSIRRM